MRSVVFYISGHGYGHVVRMAEVIRETQRLRPDWRIVARTQAPPQMLPAGVDVFPGKFESGVIERETGVVMDEYATMESLQRFVSRWDVKLEEELRFARTQRPDLIVADIPPMAGDVAAGLQVPCIAIANFTWDWIYQPYAADHLSRLEHGYSRMSALLRLPFHQSERLGVFPKIVDAPLIARKARVNTRPGARSCSDLALRFRPMLLPRLSRMRRSMSL